MNSEYERAAKQAAELERAAQFSDAALKWMTAASHASEREAEYADNRLHFCINATTGQPKKTTTH